MSFHMLMRSLDRMFRVNDTTNILLRTPVFSVTTLPNNPLELTAHSTGLLGYPWRFLLWATAHRGR